MRVVESREENNRNLQTELPRTAVQMRSTPNISLAHRSAKASLFTILLSQTWMGRTILLLRENRARVVQHTGGSSDHSGKRWNKHIIS